MKKNLCALIQNLLKIGLCFFILLLFSLVAIGGNISISYAKKPHSEKTPVPSYTTTPTSNPTATPVVTPTPTATPIVTPTPTATPIVTPVPASTQKASSYPQVAPRPTTALSINPMATANLPTATPVGVPQSATPTTLVATATLAKTRIPIPAPPRLQKTTNNEVNTFTLSLALGFAIPSLMISAGALWLLGKWLINRQRLEREQETQASPQVNSSGMQTSSYALQSASGAALNATIPSTSILGNATIPSISTLETGTGTVSPAQPTYTPSDLRPITLALPPQMFTVPLNGVAHYPVNGDLQPLPMQALDLALEVTRAIEANGNGHMSLLADTPRGLADIPTSSVPSSPPKPVVL
jgi:hypothetical protein